MDQLKDDVQNVFETLYGVRQKMVVYAHRDGLVLIAQYGTVTVMDFAQVHVQVLEQKIVTHVSRMEVEIQLANVNA